MRSIKISDEVWQALAKQGRFGETEDDVLRRVFKLKQASVVRIDGSGSSSNALLAGPNKRAQSLGRGHFATNRMHAKVYQGKTCDNLRVLFHGNGADERWDLPKDRSAKGEIRAVMNAALAFGEANGASRGQLFAIRKALTDAGYHLSK